MTDENIPDGYEIECLETPMDYNRHEKDTIEKTNKHIKQMRKRILHLLFASGEDNRFKINRNNREEYTKKMLKMVISDDEIQELMSKLLYRQVILAFTDLGRMIDIMK